MLGASVRDEDFSFYYSHSGKNVLVLTIQFVPLCRLDPWYNESKYVLASQW